MLLFLGVGVIRMALEPIDDYKGFLPLLGVSCLWNMVVFWLLLSCWMKLGRVEEECLI